MLSISDIIWAAIASLIITWTFVNIRKLFIIIRKPSMLEKKTLELNKILQKCYNMFPNEQLIFGDMTVNRGEFIRIKTTGNKVIEGKFIGLNNDNVLCIVTRRNIIAHQLDNTRDIIIIDNGDMV